MADPRHTQWSISTLDLRVKRYSSFALEMLIVALLISCITYIKAEIIVNPVGDGPCIVQYPCAITYPATFDDTETLLISLLLGHS
jgi:hypothetical protein